jgi:hypothetical protein
MPGKVPSGLACAKVTTSEGPDMGKPQNKPATSRNPDGTLKKGAALNPGGRPKLDAVFRERAKKAVDEHVLQAWIDEVVNRGDAWPKCSELLAAYGYGKPPAAPEDGDALRESGNRLPAGLTAEQVLAIARGETP